jgi:hypothetical protein
VVELEVQQLQDLAVQVVADKKVPLMLEELETLLL